MANPSSSTTSTLGLELLYEGVKVDNDIFNRNFEKIDTALKGVMMYEKLVGTTYTDVYRSAAVTTNYPTTNFDFMTIKLIGGGVTTAGTGVGAFQSMPPIKLLKPTGSITFPIPVYYFYESDTSASTLDITFTTTSLTVPKGSYNWRETGKIIVEYYKYSTT